MEWAKVVIGCVNQNQQSTLQGPVRISFLYLCVCVCVHVLVCVWLTVFWAVLGGNCSLRLVRQSANNSPEVYCIETQGSAVTRGLRKIQTPHDLWESLTPKDDNHCLMGEQLEMPLNFKIHFSPEF